MRRVEAFKGEEGDGWSYRLGWKAMPLARDDFDSNYLHRQRLRAVYKDVKGWWESLTLVSMDCIVN